MLNLELLDSAGVDFRHTLNAELAEIFNTEICNDEYVYTVHELVAEIENSVQVVRQSSQGMNLPLESFHLRSHIASLCYVVNIMLEKDVVEVTEPVLFLIYMNVQNSLNQVLEESIRG